MTTYGRLLDLNNLLERKSFFLFGPRSTGKTTLIGQTLPRARVYDLLDAETYRRLLARPRLLAEETREFQGVVVIDEIQKLPGLLDEVHRLIQSRNTRFLLTGSSSRKLKRGASNLLAGRAWTAELFPLVSREIPNFDLTSYLNTGGLPHVYGSPDAFEELQAYVGLYLREEVQAESLTRDLPAFARFLDAIALSNGAEINYDSMSSDCGVSPKTLKNYLSILEDTLIGFRLPGYTKTKKRKAISRAKHYLFDVGVVNTLCRRGKIVPGSELFGKAFEHFIVQEVRAYNSYQRTHLPLCYWRSTSKFEVDLVIGDQLAVEIKSTELVQDKHLKGIRALKEEGLIASHCVVSLDTSPRTTDDGIRILPWRDFLDQLWSGSLLESPQHGS